MLLQAVVALRVPAHEQDQYRIDAVRQSSLRSLLQIDTMDHPEMLSQSLLESSYDGQCISYISNFLFDRAHRNVDSKLATPCLSLLALAST